MLARIIGLAGVVVFAGLGIASAQDDGPAELPAADYQGQSYVDSQGCIFLKAGYGGEATWVARVGADRKPICGQTPTNAVDKISAAAATDVPVPPKLRQTKRYVRNAAPHVPVMIGCPISVPVARRYATTDGGSVVICTAANGSLTGARSPIYPAGSGVGAALSANRYSGVAIPLQQGQAANTLASGPVSPPPGYEAAWKDDRFNPLRGKSVPSGRVTSNTPSPRDVPAETVVVAVAAPQAAKSARAVAANAGSYYVQVGAFGEPSNAQRASDRLKALGLPVSKGRFTKQGRALQVIYAGPFASGEDARAALDAARGNGFSDAFIR